MIAFVRGRVDQVGLDRAVLDVGGVGFELRCAPGTLAALRPGQEAQVATSLVVREDSLTLFGFADTDERELFELLQTASGVGPKLAQAMLAVHPPGALRRAVLDEDVRALTRVPGIGQKGAQRIILELKDRIGPAADPATAAPAPTAAGDWRGQVREALVGLGWSAREAERGIDAVVPAPQDHTEPAPDVASVLRSALRAMSSA